MRTGGCSTHEELKRRIAELQVLDTQWLNSAGTAFWHLCLAFHHLKLPFHPLKLSFRHGVMTFRHHLGEIIKIVATSDQRSDFKA